MTWIRRATPPRVERPRRRGISALLLVATLAAPAGCGGSSGDPEPVTSECNGDCFPNLVAAGDVEPSSVVLWARASFTGVVQFEYGRDPDFEAPPDGTRKVVVDDPDLPAKALDIDDLLPGTRYHYRACRRRCAPGMAPEDEARGRFRTPHAEGHHGLRFGISSCFKDDFRPFAAVSNVPGRDLDFFVALGDTVYADRANSVDDFRRNHKKVYGAKVSQDDNLFARARASTAVFVSIDDHEVRNDFAGGAPPRPEECSNAGEEIGICNDVCNAAVECCDEGDPNCDRDFYNDTDVYTNSLQAFHEYNPIREETYGANLGPRMSGEPKLYRERRFGKDAAVFVLDARSFRDAPIPGAGGFLERAAFDNRRTMLGPAQRDELMAGLQAAQDAGITWKLVLIPEPIQNVGPIPPPRDRFAGYAHERQMLLHFIERNCIDNVVFISGDIHMNIVNNLVYKRSLVDFQRYSAAWDISTGPAGHESAGSIATREPAFSTLLEARLRATFLPRPGLELEDYIDAQDWNSVPYTFLGGDGVSPWSTANKLSWSEFEIDAASQTLRVTTYGVDFYEPGTDVDEILRRDHSIMNHFEVEPRSAAARQTCLQENAPLDALAPCYADIECASGTCVQACPQGQCLPGVCCVPPFCTQQCGDGTCEGTEACGDANNTSPSVSLEFRECRADCDLCENGTFCLEHGDCDSGVCNVGFCVGRNQLRAFTPCSTDDACVSGRCEGFVCRQDCGDGSCDGTEKCGDGNSLVECQADCGLCPIGSACLQDTDCQDGKCALLVCADCAPPCRGACNAAFDRCDPACQAGPFCGPVCDACKAGCRETRDLCRAACNAACG